MKKNLSTLFLILALSFSKGQAQTTTYTIEGDVVEAKNTEAIPSANVFLEGTTIGTQSDSKGHFIIKNITSGNYQLAASMVGFQTFSQKIMVSANNITVKISMLEDVKSLEEVKVSGERDRIWEKQFKVFEKEFLGSYFDKKEVKIINKEVLDFQFKEGELSANATQPLVIENKALGYKITYILKGFEKNKTKTYFKGIPRYEKLISKNIEEERAWEKNRQIAYKGSLMHFLKSLLEDNLEEEGFDAHFVNPNFVKKTSGRILFYELSERNVPLRPKEIIQKINEQPLLYRLLWTYPLEVVYKKQRAGMSVFPDAPHPYTLLVPLNTIFVTDNGNLLDPYSVEIRGKMGELGYADLLPLDYVLPQKNNPNSSTDKVLVSKPSEYLSEQLIQNQDQKIYLHTDKIAYFAGDTLWYKAYITDAITNKIVIEPQKFFVELISKDKPLSPVFKQILQTNEHGIAWSNIELPDTLLTNTYQVRAYTNWMKNFDNPIIFQKEIFVKNSRLPDKVQTISEENFDVKFFPESGQWLSDAPVRMGVKVFAKNKSIVSGILLDEKNREIQRFTTNEMGIGSFEIKRKEYQNLKFRIENKDFELPKPIPNGFVMQVNNLENDSLKVDVFSSKEHSNENIDILIQSKGTVYFELSKKLVGNTISFALSKKEFSTGVYQITLFDKNLLPTAERLFFVRNNKNIPKIEISETVLQNKIGIDLQLKQLENNVAGEFSMSIADASQVSFSSSSENIFSYLLLSSEVKGKIENSNYYFRDFSPETVKALDDLLLTQGWRRYNWNDVLLQKKLNHSKYQAFEPISIKGKVYSNIEKKIVFPNINLMILPIDSIQRPIFTQTDKDGNFLVSNLGVKENVKYAVKFSDKKKREVIGHIVFDEDSLSFKSQLINTTNTQMFREYFLQNSDSRKQLEFQREKEVRMLAEVTVNSKKTFNPDYDSYGKRLNKLYGEPDGTIMVTENMFGSNVVQLIQGKIPAIKISGDGINTKFTYYARGRGTITNNHPQSSSTSGISDEINGSSSNGGTTDEPPLFVLDGVIVPVPRGQEDLLMGIPVQDIERVDYLIGASSSMYGVRASNGVIAIYTKTAGKGALSKSRLLSTKLLGFQKNKELYEPNTDLPDDVRDILLWKPSIQLIAGRLKSFSFWNNSVATKLLIAIEGVLENGEPYASYKLIDSKR
jgi:hypothetical protein